MKSKLNLYFFFIVLLFLLTNCAVPTKSDPLPSWNNGITKQSIIDFVNEATDSANPNFVSLDERIAVFDNDGTLWTEQPIYFQIMFVIDRVKEMAKDHPEWKEKQPYKAVLENDIKTLFSSEKWISELFVITHTGMSTAEFYKIGHEWLKKAKHPKFNRPLTDMVFQPMLELMKYLRQNGFKTYIVSGGGQTFIRLFAEQVYGIPPEKIIGTLFEAEFKIVDGKPEIYRLPKVFLFNDKGVKAVAIEKFIGRIPVMAFGNSDGDLQMLQYTQSGKGKRFMALVHHTDSTREYAYDRNSRIGQLNKAWDEAVSNNWTLIDMKNDWKVIYPFELDQ
ncbi:MAG: haloacid dehalogenase-like hydrolase [Chlorobi bacterium]|nr:haloacid dehalogenase-like hydrolase [Chlorobiota bacterium]